MGDGGGKAVRRVVRAGNFIEAEQHLEHLLHLLMVRFAVDRDGQLDLLGCILVEIIRIFTHGHHGGSARLTDRDGGGDVLAEEQLFHCNVVR